MKILLRYFAFIGLAIALMFGTGCAGKGEAGKDSGRVEVDQEVLEEIEQALGDEGGSEKASREEILARKKAREEAKRKAEARKQAEEQARAERSARETRTTDPEIIRLRETCKRCDFYLTEKNLDKALENAKALVVERPTASDSHLVLGIIHRKRGELEDAVKAQQQALKLDPSNELAAANLAIAYRYQGAFEKAADFYDKYLKRYPDATQMHYNAGVFYELYVGDAPKALGHYVTYLRKGGEREEEVNGWVTTLARLMDIERPLTPGKGSPNAAEYLASIGKGPSVTNKPETTPEEPVVEETPAEVGEAAAEGGEDAAGGAVPVAAADGSSDAAAAGSAGAEAAAGGADESTQAAAAGASTAGGAAAAGGAVAGTAAVEAGKPLVVFYPLGVTKGESVEDTVDGATEAVRKALGDKGELVTPAALAEIETRKGWQGKCDAWKCQVAVGGEAGADLVVHGRLAKLKGVWHVQLLGFDLKNKRKTEERVSVPESEGTAKLFGELNAAAGRLMKWRADASQS